MKYVRGIRGAIRVAENSAEAITAGTKELLGRMVEANAIDTVDIVSVFLTTTTDLNAVFPAYAARDMGWTDVPLLCAQEIEVPKAMTRLIRILIHVNTDLEQHQIKHLYLGETQALRPDLAEKEDAS